MGCGRWSYWTLLAQSLLTGGSCVCRIIIADGVYISLELAV